MRIGIVAAEFPPERGGMQEHARGLVTWLADRHELVVVSKPGRSLPLPNVVFDQRQNDRLANDAAVMAQHDVALWIVLSAQLAPLALRVQTPVAVYVHGVDAVRPWAPVSSPYAIAKRLVGGRVVSVVNGFERAWRLREISAGLSAAAGLFANSAATASVVAARHGLDTEAFRIVHPGVDPGFASIPGREPGERLRLLSVARLSASVRRKNIEGVIRAVAALRRERAITYRVVGSGPDLPRLKILAQDLGVGDRVEFLGDLDQEQLRDAYRSSDAFIMAVEPTPTDIEGFGMVYAEAACAGLPSIAVDNGGVSEAVEHGRTGILLKDPSIESIIEGIREFASRREGFDEAEIRRFGLDRTAPETTAKLWAAIEQLPRFPGGLSRP